MGVSGLMNKDAAGRIAGGDRQGTAVDRLEERMERTGRIAGPVLFLAALPVGSMQVRCLPGGINPSGKRKGSRGYPGEFVTMRSEPL